MGIEGVRTSEPREPEAPAGRWPHVRVTRTEFEDFVCHVFIARIHLQGASTPEPLKKSLETKLDLLLCCKQLDVTDVSPVSPGSGTFC